MPRLSVSPSPDRGRLLDRVTKSQQNSLAKRDLVLCLPLPQPGQIAPGRPSCSPSPLGLSPPNPLSGAQSSGPPALDRKLSAPLAHRAGSLPAGKAGYLPPALLAETQPLFPAAARKSPRPSLPWGPCSLQISRSGNFPCAVFQAGRASRTKARERQRPSSLLHHPLLRLGRGDPGDGDHPSWRGLCFGSNPWRSRAQISLEQSPVLPGLLPQGGNTGMLALT